MGGYQKKLTILEISHPTSGNDPIRKNKKKIKEKKRKKGKTTLKKEHNKEQK